MGLRKRQDPGVFQPLPPETLLGLSPPGQHQHPPRSHNPRVPTGGDKDPRATWPQKGGRSAFSSEGTLPRVSSGTHTLPQNHRQPPCPHSPPTGCSKISAGLWGLSPSAESGVLARPGGERTVGTGDTRALVEGWEVKLQNGGSCCCAGVQSPHDPPHTPAAIRGCQEEPLCEAAPRGRAPIPLPIWGCTQGRRCLGTSSLPHCGAGRTEKEGNSHQGRPRPHLPAASPGGNGPPIGRKPLSLSL